MIFISRRKADLPALIAPALLVLFAAFPAHAQEDEAYPDRLDGTLSALGDLEDDEAARTSWLRFPTLLDPWMESKARFRAATGINFGGSLGLLWQNYSDPLLGEPNAAGYKLTFNLSKDIINAGTPEALSFDMAIEARGPLGTPLPPLQGGVAAGNIVPTAATWGDFDLGVTQFYIRQSLFGNRFQYAIGKLFAPNYVNSYPFFDDNRQFLNQNFSTNPTIASALRGFGAVALVYPTDGGLYVQGGIFNANSEDTGPTIGTFFSEQEYFTTAEIGWSGLARSGVPQQARGPMDQNNVHLTWWHKDAQPGAATIFQPEMEGFAFNANFMAGDNLMWFLRGGKSEGWVTTRALSAGFGYRPESAPSDLFGFGLAWSEPLLASLRDQTTMETFYRFQVTQNLAITPDLQIIIDPTLNPAVDSQIILGLRGRITF
jgi:porin